jgi:hypothetical protein
MKFTRTFMLSIMILCLVLLNSNVKALSQDTSLSRSNCLSNADLNNIISCESKMPDTVNSKKSESLKKSEMNVWKADTRDYLESFHKQKIVKIEEDSKKVTFIFEIDFTNFTDEVVEKVEYYKDVPVVNSVGNGITPNIIVIPPDGGSSTKITYTAVWVQGATPVNTAYKSFLNMNAALQYTISLVTWIAGVNAGLMAYTIASYYSAQIDAALPLSVETRAALRNKTAIGSYFMSISGMWLGIVQIGRQEAWYYRTLYKPNYAGGPFLPFHYDNIPLSPYNNFNDFRIKPHYNDTTWIRTKAYELGIAGQGGIYYDAY